VRLKTIRAFYPTSAILQAGIEPAGKMVHPSPPQAGGALRTFFVKGINFVTALYLGRLQSQE